MQLPTHLLAMVVTNTANADQAARYADLLGASVEGLTTKVGLPSEWVLLAQKRSVAQAAFAVSNCQDPVVLQKISRSARRVAVRLALARNPHTSNDTLRVMLSEASESNDYELLGVLKANLGRVPFEQRFDHYVAHARTALRPQNSDEVFEFLNDPRVSLEQVRTVLDAASLLQNWLHEFYVLHAYDVGSSLYAPLGDTSLKCWADRDVFAHPTEALLGLSRATQRKIIKKLIKSQVRAACYVENFLPLDAAMTKMVLTLLSNSEIDTRDYYAPTMPNIFDEASIDLLIADSAHHDIARSQLLTDAQFMALVNGSNEKSRMALSSVINDSRARLEYWLAHLDPDTRFDGSEDVGAAELLADTISDPTDPLIKALMNIANEADIRNFLVGKVDVSTPSSERHVVLADAQCVPALVQYGFGPNASSWEISSAVSALESLYQNPEHRDYVRSVVVHAPRVTTTACHRPGLSSLVFEQLSSTGAELELALAQLANNPELALVELCESLALLAPSTK